jgi:hypothetical protein
MRGALPCAPTGVADADDELQTDAEAAEHAKNYKGLCELGALRV